MDVFYGSVITIDDLLSSIFGNTPDEDYDNQLKFMEKIAKKIGSTTNKAVAVTPSDYQPYVPDGDDVEFEGKRIVRVGKVYHKGYSADIFQCDSMKFAVEILEGEIWMYFPSEEDFNKLSELLWKDYDELEESINTDLSGEFMKDYNKARIKYYEEFPNAKTPFDDALKLFQASEKGNKNSLLWPLYSEEAWQELLDFIRDYN